MMTPRLGADLALEIAPKSKFYRNISTLPVASASMRQIHHLMGNVNALSFRPDFKMYLYVKRQGHCPIRKDTAQETVNGQQALGMT